MEGASPELKKAEGRKEAGRQPPTLGEGADPKSHKSRTHRKAGQPQTQNEAPTLEILRGRKPLISERELKQSCGSERIHQFDIRVEKR